MVIKDRAFKNRRIRGPACVYCDHGDGSDVFLDGCVFKGHPEAVLAEVDNQYVPVGAIILRGDIRFVNCDIEDVSIIARSGDIARMRMQVHVPASEKEPDKGTILDGLLTPRPGNA